MKKLLPFALILVAASPPEAPNPVQREMRLLESAMQASVSAIAAGDVRHLPKLLHAVHTAAGDTKTALKTGAYKPPRGAEQVDLFIKLDDEFHAEMIKMVKAARKNKVEETAAHFGALMTRCHGCHAVFRAPPAKK
jgi:hypothetical protein